MPDHLAVGEPSDVKPSSEASQQLRAILDALPRASGAVDTPMRRKVADIIDGLDLLGS